MPADEDLRQGAGRNGQIRELQGSWVFEVLDGGNAGGVPRLPRSVRKNALYLGAPSPATSIWKTWGRGLLSNKVKRLAGNFEFAMDAATLIWLAATILREDFRGVFLGDWVGDTYALRGARDPPNVFSRRIGL